MTANQDKHTIENINKQVEAFALDHPNMPVKFRETTRMKRLNKGQLPVSDYVVHCISNKNYRMLFAYMNTCGYNRISLDVASKIPLFDVLAIFPQGCFQDIHVSGRPNTTSIDPLLIYCWLFGRIGDVITVLFTAVLHTNFDFEIISNLGDLKRDPFQLVKEILRDLVYNKVIIHNYINTYDESRFLGQDIRQDFTAIRNDVIKLVNAFLKLLDPYLNFYEENQRSYRLAFIGWSLPQVDFEYFSQYNNSLKPFRHRLFDFGPLPVWSKANHLKYPRAFRKQVKTFLLMKQRKGTIVNLLFHKDLLGKLFEYMAFNSLLVEEEDIKEDYRYAINLPCEEDCDEGCCRKRQRMIE